MTFSRLGSSMKQLSESVQSLADTVMSVIQQFNKTLSEFYTNGYYDVGRLCVASHDDVGVVEGHIAEHITDSTVTVARASDGVLVHLHRDDVVRTVER